MNPIINKKIDGVFNTELEIGGRKYMYIEGKWYFNNGARKIEIFDNELLKILSQNRVEKEGTVSKKIDKIINASEN